MTSTLRRLSARRQPSLETPIRVSAGRVLIREGSVGRQFLRIVEGNLRVTRTVDGVEREVAMLGPGDFAGEMSLLGDRLASATVTAATDALVAVSNAAEFRDLRDANQIRAVADTRREANEAEQVVAAS